MALLKQNEKPIQLKKKKKEIDKENFAKILN